MRRPGTSDQALVHDLVFAGLRELAIGRGGRLYLDDLANYLGVTDADLVDTVTSEVMSQGFLTDDAVAVAIDGLALIYVDPAKRRQRTGTALYRALWEDGNVELWTKPGDRTAKSFAESLGLKARLLIMSAEQSPNDAQ
jgi:GNAT superfamily N-acetyltransferase